MKKGSEMNNFKPGINLLLHNITDRFNDELLERPERNRHIYIVTKYMFRLAVSS